MDLTITDISDFVFCPRRLWLRHSGESVEHEDQARGKHTHRVVDREPIHVRDAELGIYGKCDAVRDESGAEGVHLREYKSSLSAGRGISESTLAQLASYRRCLESEGVTVKRCSVYFTEQRTSEDVALEQLDKVDVDKLVKDARAVVTSDKSPPVLEDDRRCGGCSQVSVCSPSERLLTDPRVVVPRPDGAPLIIDNSVKYVSIKNRKVLVESRDGSSTYLPLTSITCAIVFGNAAMSTAFTRELLYQNKPVVYCTYSGRAIGYSAPVAAPNGLIRSRLAALDDSIKRYLAIQSLSAKLHNQAALIGRYGSKHAASTIRALEIEVDKAPDNASLFMLEASAASAYFDAFFKGVPSWARERGSVKRIKRGASDPVNILLNYAYALTFASVTRAVLAVGLDPSAGFLHSSGRNKPALVLDVGEQFRAPIADSVVRTLLTKGMVRESGFSYTRSTSVMREDTRKLLISQVFKRMNTEHSYIHGGYPMSWDRSIEHTVRRLVRFMDGSLDTWEGVRVR